MSHNQKDVGPQAHPDPITGEPGCHPVGTGIGAAAGGVAVAAAGGILGGPVGAAVGAVAGTIIGGLAGKATAEDSDPSVEEEYWRQNYPTRPYYNPDEEYEKYAPAYRYGWESRSKYPGQNFTEVQDQLRDEWDASSTARPMSWEKARPAISDAWNRSD